MDKSKEIIEIIAGIINVPVEEVTVESKMEDFAQWDSLAQMMIIGALEEKMGISISLDQAMEIEGVQQILELCQ